MKFDEKQKTDEGIENYRNLKGYWLIIINILAVSLSLFHLYTSGFGLLPALKQRAFHLMLLTPLAFLLYPVAAKFKKRNPQILDILFSIITVITTSYIIVNFEAFAFRAGRATQLDLIIGAIFILLILEGTRRTIVYLYDFTQFSLPMLNSKFVKYMG